MSVLDELLQGIVDDPQAEDRWLVLADWLEEHDDPRRAELLRLHRTLLTTCCQPERHPERQTAHVRLVQLLAHGVRPCVPQRTVVLSDGVEMRFSFIPPGTFLMGSPAKEYKRQSDETQHRVTLTQGYYLGVSPVTQAQWRAVMGVTPSRRFQGDDRPVETLSWGDCQKFCDKLGERTANDFRLPTEAEWEHACRAGTTTPFHHGDTITPEQANYYGEAVYGSGVKGPYRQETTPVGQFPPNAWGLVDLHGNVWEWCQDSYGPYPRGHQEDPLFPPGARGSCVLRGGSWCDTPWYCRSASRLSDAPTYPRSDFGCRVCLSVD
jgi:uncharacterized protein (TIGR02996 family)